LCDNRFSLVCSFFHPSLLVLLARTCWLIIFCRLKKKVSILVSIRLVGWLSGWSLFINVSILINWWYYDLIQDNVGLYNSFIRPYMVKHEKEIDDSSLLELYYGQKVFTVFFDIMDNQCCYS